MPARTLVLGVLASLTLLAVSPPVDAHAGSYPPNAPTCTVSQYRVHRGETLTTSGHQWGGHHVGISFVQNGDKTFLADAHVRHHRFRKDVTIPQAAGLGRAKIRVKGRDTSGDRATCSTEIRVVSS